MRFLKTHILPLWILVFGFCFSGVSWALPSPQGTVNDFASVLNPSTIQHVEELSASLDASTGIELAVVTIPSLEGDSVEDYAVRLFENWKIGKKGKDNGLLLLIAPAEKKAHIEVGYGLEGTLNDAKATRLLRDYFVPQAREGDLNGAVTETTEALYQMFAEGNEGEKPATRSRKGSSLLSFLILIIILYLAIRHPFLFLMLMSSGGRSSGFGGFGGGGSGGGGFGGFGGGSSGGGGGSSGW
ncbi:MAG: TPM domain-containing protein [bacterium]|nr:TPM domain-containing protein [bacterium]